MEENQNQEELEKKKDEKQPIYKNEYFLKTLMVGFLIFLGAYCAFYTVADWHMKSMWKHTFRPNFRQMERMLQKDMQAMDNFMRAEKKFAKKSAQVIHLEQNKDAYKVLIDLRAFDNDKKNVEVNTNGNILTISGRSIRRAKNNEQISEFQQNYLFGDNVMLKDLTKATNGNYYVITIPINDNDD